MYKNINKSEQNKIYFKYSKNTCRRTVVYGIYIYAICRSAFCKSTTCEVGPYNILEDEFSCSSS